MAKNKKTNVEQAKEVVNNQQKEARLENDITKLPSGKGGQGSGSGSSSGGNGGKKVVGVTPTNGSQTESREYIDPSLSAALDSFKKELKENGEITANYNKVKAEGYGVNTENGNSQFYQSLSTIKKEKDEAEEELEKAKSDNKTLSENRLLKDSYEKALKAGKKSDKEVNKLYKSKEKGLKKQEKQLAKDTKGLYRENIEGELDETNKGLVDIDVAKLELEKSDEWISNTENPELQERMKSLSEQQMELTNKRTQLLGQLESLDSLDSVRNELEELKEQQKVLTSSNIDALVEWANTSGTDDDKARAATIKGLRDSILKADEDGQITEEEANGIKALMEKCDDLIENEEKTDKNIIDAQKKYDSAKAKFSYYLFDQIKSIAAFLVGLSVGSPQMVYSALDMFNKQIADSEANYRTNTIAAFSNNNIKAITGKSDAQYTMEQLLPELEKQKAFMQLDQEQKANSVIALEKAFEEFRRYVNRGGNEDFRAWFTAQTQSGNASGWAAVVMQLISAGALNWDIINKVFNGGGGSSGVGDAIINGTKKKGPVSLNTKGRTNQIMQNILQSANDELIGKMSTPAATRDKQATVNNVLASKVGAKGAPQGQALQTGQGWGNSIG